MFDGTQVANYSSLKRYIKETEKAYTEDERKNKQTNIYRETDRNVRQAGVKEDKKQTVKYTGSHSK